MSNIKYPVILSFDVGIIHLSYCLLTQSIFTQPDGTKISNWNILEWNNIDLTNRDEQKCTCGAKAFYTQTINNEIKYYCKTHSKKIDKITQTFNECFIESKTTNNCEYEFKNLKTCGKSSSYKYNDKHYCTSHAKQLYKIISKSSELKVFKMKNSITSQFDEIKYKLIMELENRKNLLSTDYVVIENQPSFKNPRMKSIASTLYDYYLIRGIIDKNITNSNIKQVKFISPSNKLKIINENDNNELIKVKNNESKSYKLTKSLSIKYCNQLISHLDIWKTFFNNNKKKDDLADSFLQGVYFYTYKMA